MRKILSLFIIFFSTIIISPNAIAQSRIETVRANKLEIVKKELEENGLKFGSPIFMRIYKSQGILELWVKENDIYKKYKEYKICAFSGNLGPKLKEGDKQAPEGIYWVKTDQLNPQSDYHLSFNLGFPNEYDQFHNRTGSYLMVHGNCLSVGCYAMTDEKIEEIYLILEAALQNGQDKVQIHALPFRPSKFKLWINSNNQWHDFWKELSNIDMEFEKTKIPPNIKIENGHYTLAE